MSYLTGPNQRVIRQESVPSAALLSVRAVSLPQGGGGGGHASTSPDGMRCSTGFPFVAKLM